MKELWVGQQAKRPSSAARDLQRRAGATSEELTLPPRRVRGFVLGFSRVCVQIPIESLRVIVRGGLFYLSAQPTKNRLSTRKN